VNDRRLAVLLGGSRIGDLEVDAQGRLSLTYADDWRRFPGAIALSLSLPLAAARHEHAAVDAFLWGLLPDNERVLERWAAGFQVSARSAFALLRHVGEDCVGAVQFVRAERLDAVLSPAAPEVEWLSERQVEERVRALRTDRSAWRREGDLGHFSLPGAQPKTALLLQDGRWGIPAGRTPTTHIVKPELGELDGHAANECFCLALARSLGLPAANAELRQFGDTAALVVERYDRAYTAALAAEAAAEAAAKAALAAASLSETAAAATVARLAAESAAAAARADAMRALSGTLPILRLHQEDMCQALGLRPELKYQNEGGPSPEAVGKLLRSHSGRPVEDLATLVGALAFNWLIGGTDAHAKNYGLLHGAQGRVRLAPLYDVASLLPYPGFDAGRAKLAMKIGGEYRLAAIGARQWRRLAADLRLEAEAVLAQVEGLAQALPDAAADLRRRLDGEAVRHPVLGRLAGLFAARAKACRNLLSLGRPA